VNRRAYIDWLRGLAVVIMIEAHTIDAWTVTDSTVRASRQFTLLQFLAGWAAPLFLWLAGVSVALAIASHLRKGRTMADASWQVQKRGWEVLGMAYLFRLQSFMLSPTASWKGLLKVDILNVMGLAMVAAAWCSARGRSARSRVLWLLVPAALCVLLAQFAPGWSWPELLGDRLQGYIRLVGAGGNFTLFPWAGFVLAGAWMGQLLLVNRDATTDRRFHLRLGLAGVMLAVLAYGLGCVPAVTPHSTYWFSSSSWFLMRLGVMTVMLALAWLWMQRPTSQRWSPMVVFGQTSLFVYWVHVEVVYGFPTYPIRHAFSIAGALTAYALFTGIMLALAILWAKREKAPLIPERLRVG
jgi:uncharacterized membrane protein